MTDGEEPEPLQAMTDGEEPEPLEPVPPLLRAKGHETPSVFQPANLLREARRQRGLLDKAVPAICVLDPDGDITDAVIASGAETHPGWACYHTTLHSFTLGGRQAGVIGRAVGAPFAVLLAEQLFTSGCELLISMTSAGQITALGDPPYFVVIDRAWRDEGTSLHYLPPSPWSHLADRLRDRLVVPHAFDGLAEPVVVGASWTTDAPYRETPAAISAAEREAIAAVEMEAAALYAFAQAAHRDVVCLAHVTNTMAVDGDDFEKGDDGGVERSLLLIDAVARAIGR